RAAFEGDLAARDRTDAHLAGGVGEGQRSAQAVVIGERDGVVAVRGRRPGQLFRLGGAVQKRERGVGVKLGVGHLTPNMCSMRSAYRAARRRASSQQEPVSAGWR